MKRELGRVVLILAVVFSSLASSAHAAVGRLSGEAFVSSTGSAGYSIPLNLPVGTNGLTPVLTLNYNSSGGNGILGIGWSLGGLSAISRCNKTISQDGVASSATLSTSDAYCLDGQRLRLTGGNYGAAGSTYQTEVETFSRATAFGTAGNGPQSWEVWAKDGLIYEYGGTADSRIEVVGSTTPRVWAVNKIRDRSGNFIEVVWAEDTTNGGFHPSEIRYTAHASASAATKVVFVYSTSRPDPIAGYRDWTIPVVDGRVQELQRLDRIDVINIATGTTVKYFNLGYEASGGAGGRSRLNSLAECRAGDCLAATNLQWINGTNGWNSAEINTAQAAPATVIVGDIDGDGRDDVVFSSSATSGGGGWYYMLGGASGLGAAVSTGIVNSNQADAQPIEWNNDSRMDLLVPCASSANWCVMEANGSGFAAPFDTGAAATGSATAVLAADMDGDGRDDLIRNIGQLQLGLRLRSGSGFAAETIAWTPSDPNMRLTGSFGGARTQRRLKSVRRIDMNRDGREEFYLGVIIDDPEPDVPTVSTTLRFYAQGSTFVPNGGFGGPTSLAALGDFNGDGITDTVSINSTITVNISTSSGVTRTWTTPSFSGPTLVTDFDGDGLDDLLIARTVGSSTTWQVARSTGTALGTLVDLGLTASLTAFGNNYALDINGDGKMDLLRTDSSILKYRLGLGVRPDLLDRITDGFGTFTDFDYQPLSAGASGCYVRDAALPSFPIRALNGATQVVCSSTSTDGIGGTYIVEYDYFNADFDQHGRGFLGFQRKVTRDLRDNLYRIETFNQAFPYIGMLMSHVVKQPNNATVVSDVTNTVASYSYDSGARQLPYVSQTEIRKYEVGGSYNGISYDGALLSTTTTVNSVSASHGTVTDSTMTTLEGNSANGLNAGQRHVMRVFHSALFDDTANWCRGRPSTTQYINNHTMTGGTTITRTASTAWDGTYCRPSGATVEPGNTLYEVATTYGYDGFGNVTSIVQTPAGGQGQVARTTTLSWGATGRFLDWVQNPKSQQTSFGWDPLLGLRTSITYPHNRTVATQFDGFGRPDLETRPDGTKTDYELTWCNSSPCQGANPNRRVRLAAVNQTSSNAEINRQIAYFDMFDRQLTMQSQVFGGGFATVDRSFDARGLLYQSSTPYLSGDPVWQTTYSYDSIGRQTLASRVTSEGDSSSHQTQTYYLGLAVVVTDALNHSSTARRNGIGQIVQMLDATNSDTTYTYDAFGNALAVEDFYGAQTTATYNVRGDKLTSTDPDMGGWTYSYYPFGELKTQQNAKSQVVTYTYDVLSRPLTRVEPEGTTNWVWDTAANGTGQLTSVASPGGYSEAYGYDTVGRVLQTTTTISSVNYLYNYTYTAATGLLETLTYPLAGSGSRFKVRYGYEYGLLNSVQQYTDNVAGTVYWRGNAMNARQQIIDQMLGNGMQTISSYDRIAGWLDNRTTDVGSLTPQNLEYGWNKMGNLNSRKDVNQNITETFFYDSLDRLDYSQRNGVTNMDLAYDAIGNITSKTGVGSYVYHATKKHAVVTAGTNAYTYDANGNMATRNGATITWYSYDLPQTINGTGGNYATFSYGPDRQRYKQVHRTWSDSSSERTTLYLGQLFEHATEIEADGPQHLYRHYIVVGGERVASHLKLRILNESYEYEWTTYFTHDHLGSTDGLYPDDEDEGYGFSYDGFGKRRGTNWTGAPAADNLDYMWSDSSNRGFTDHEQLDNLGLIHMNGRIQDPTIGRFLSADPYVQSLYSGQSLNRYSYVFNNPLAATDPSGFQTIEEVVVTGSGGGGGAGQPGAVGGPGGPQGSQQNGPLEEKGLEFVEVVRSRLRSMGLYGLGQSGLQSASPSGELGETSVTVSSTRLPGPRAERVQSQLGDQSTKCTGTAPKGVLGGLFATNEAFRESTDANKRLTVDASQLTVKVENGFSSSGRAVGTVQGADWLVHGTVSLQRDASGRIIIVPESYNLKSTHSLNQDRC